MNIQQECICCGEKFELMGHLIDHMRDTHSEPEVMAALADQEESQLYQN